MNKLFGVLLALTLLAPAAMADDSSTGAKALANAAMFPLHLTTGALGGAFGLVSGSVEGVGNLEKKVFASQGRTAENGYVEANVLTWPVDVLEGVAVAPVGVLMGAPKGFATGFRSGWQVWNNVH